MAKTRDYMDYLDDSVPLAPANSQEELQAAETIAGVMRDHGLDARIEEFDAHPLGQILPHVLVIVMLVCLATTGLTEGPVHTVTLLIALLVIALLLYVHFGNDLFENLGPGSRSQNVVGVHRAEGPRVVKGARPIVVVSHYDTPRENIMYGPLANVQTTLKPAAIVCKIIVAVVLLVQAMAFLPVVVRIVFWVIGLLVTLPLLVLAVAQIMERLAPCTVGANDNKSSVAAMLGVVDTVRPAPDRAMRAEGNRPIRRRTEQAPAEWVEEEQVAPVSQPAPRPAQADVPMRRVEVAEEVKGVRHGQEVLAALGILPASCEVVYEQPRVRVVEEPVPAPAVEPVCRVEPEPASINEPEINEPERGDLSKPELHEDDDWRQSVVDDVPTSSPDEEEPHPAFVMDDQWHDDEMDEQEQREAWIDDEDFEEDDDYRLEAADDESEDEGAAEEEADEQEDQEPAPRRRISLPLIRPFGAADDEEEESAKDARDDVLSSEADEDYDEESYDEDEYEDEEPSLSGWIAARMRSLRAFLEKNKEDYDELDDYDDESFEDDEVEDEGWGAEDDDTDWGANEDEDSYEDEASDESDRYDDEDYTDEAEDDDASYFEDDEYEYDDDYEDEVEDEEAYDEDAEEAYDDEFYEDDSYEELSDEEDDEESDVEDEPQSISDRLPELTWDDEESDEVEDSEEEEDESEEHLDDEDYDEDEAYAGEEDEVEDDTESEGQDAQPAPVSLSELPGFDEESDEPSDQIDEDEEEEPLEEAPTAAVEDEYDVSGEYDDAYDDYEDDYDDYDDEYEDSYEDDEYEDEYDPLEDEPEEDTQAEQPAPAEVPAASDAGTTSVIEDIVDEDDEWLDDAFDDDLEDDIEDEATTADEAEQGADLDPYTSASGGTGIGDRLRGVFRKMRGRNVEGTFVQEVDEEVGVGEDASALESLAEGTQEAKESFDDYDDYLYDDEYDETYDEDDYENEDEVVLRDPNMLHVDREEDADIVPRDTTGLDTISDSYDLYSGQNPREARTPRPAPVDDPTWGTSSYNPPRPAINIARRAALYDLPDPSAATVDPFEDEGEFEDEFEPVEQETPTETFAEEVVEDTSEEAYEDNEWFDDYEDEDAADDGPSFWGGSSSSPKWKGGAALRSDLRDADPWGDDPIVIDEDDLQNAILEMGDDLLIAHDIWFVATGASACGHAGIKAFIDEHRRDLRGAFLVNLESIGAGDLVMYTREGNRAPRNADRRLVSLVTSIACDLHLGLDTVSCGWDETDAASAMRQRIRSISLVGVDENNLPALSHTADDAPENVNPKQVSAVVRLVTELIRRA